MWSGKNPGSARPAGYSAVGIILMDVPRCIHGSANQRHSHRTTGGRRAHLRKFQGMADRSRNSATKHIEHRPADSMERPDPQVRERKKGGRM